MPSVDVVSKVDLQTIDNVINNVKREVSTRYDFRNVRTEMTLVKKENRIHIVTGDEMKAKSVREMIVDQCVKLKIDPKCMDFKDFESTSQGAVKTDIIIKEGIPKETCQQMVKLIKPLKLKVQTTIQDQQLRLAGKKIDDLQTIIQLLKEQDYDVPLQFVNMKS
ncbi:MAG: YajQ family cyclic di-GMP-binding protein [Chloroflexota bacterium]|nr:YajQ family cyclic di-GMP-binding protein [Chloroflexota bacterium]